MVSSLLVGCNYVHLRESAVWEQEVSTVAMCPHSYELFLHSEMFFGAMRDSDLPPQI